MVSGIIRVDVGVAIARRCQAGDQNRHSCVTCPTEPAKIASLNAIDQIREGGARFCRL